MPYDEYNYFTKSHMLYFFINPNLSYPIQKKDFKVLCIKCDKDTLKDYNSEQLKFDELFIDFFPHYNFPSYQSHERINIDDENFELDEKICETQEFIDDINNIASGSEGSKLFGNPQAIQGTVSFHWAIKSLGLSYHQFSDEELKKLRKKEKQFILLLQVNFSDLDITDRFGDGILYFGIRKDDLIKRDFNKVELVFQST